MEKYDVAVAKCIAGNFKSKAKNRQKTHLRNYFPAFRKFVRITGISFLRQSDFGILHIGAKGWEGVYHLPRKQAGGIPISVLSVWGGFVSDSSRDIAEILFPLPFRVAVASGLGWGDLLNTAPPKTVLTKEGLIGFASKTKTRGRSEGRPWGASHYAFSNEKRLRKGYELFKNQSADFSRDYWIGKPLILEPEL